MRLFREDDEMCVKIVCDTCKKLLSESSDDFTANLFFDKLASKNWWIKIDASEEYGYHYWKHYCKKHNPQCEKCFSIKSERKELEEIWECFCENPDRLDKDCNCKREKVTHVTCQDCGYGWIGD